MEDLALLKALFLSFVAMVMFLLFIFCMYGCFGFERRRIKNRSMACQTRPLEVDTSVPMMDIPRKRKNFLVAPLLKDSGTPIAVTQVTTTTGVHPPYPTHPLHPTPQSVQAPPPGFVPVGGYQTVPYPPVPGAAPGGTPYPPMNTPYPPTPYSPTQAAPPPSYSEAVGHNPVQPPPVQELYAKQAPYNPNY